MHTELLPAILLPGLLGLYFWRGNRVSQHRAASSPSENGVGRRYKEIFDNGSDGIFVVERLARGKFRFESLNSAAAEMIAPPETELVGRTFDQFIGRRGRSGLGVFLQELQRWLDICAGGGLPAGYECRFGGTPDKTRHLQVRLTPMADDSGISHIICFLHDITVRKSYEQELLERVRLEERLSAFAASAPGFFYSYRHGADGSNAMPFASAGICELFGLRPDSVALSIAPMNLLIHPDDMQAYIQSLARSAMDLSPLQVEFRVQHPKRGELWVESRALPRSEADGGIVWHGFMHDISERKRMEDELSRKRETLAEAQRIGRMGSWELDIPSGKLNWSDEIYRIFEIDPAIFEASYEAFLNAIHPEDRDAVDRAYRESMENRTPYCIDHRLMFPDGRIKHVRECCETHYGENGSALRSRGTVQDITELKEAQLRLLDTQERLRELVIARESLVEGERKRVAWEMHEELGQLLAAMRLRVNTIRNQLPKGLPAVEENSWALEMLIERSLKTVLEIVSELRPTVLVHGPVAALEWLVAKAGEQYGFACTLSVDEDGTVAGEELTLLAFRVAQEIIDSIARHVDVRALQIVWECRHNGCRLAVRHDADVREDRFAGIPQQGFFGIRERVSAFGGEMGILDEPAGGAVIEARFPLEKKANGQYSLFGR